MLINDSISWGLWLCLIPKLTLLPPASSFKCTWLEVFQVQGVSRNIELTLTPFLLTEVGC